MKSISIKLPILKSEQSSSSPLHLSLTILVSYTKDTVYKSTFFHLKIADLFKVYLPGFFLHILEIGTSTGL